MRLIKVYANQPTFKTVLFNEKGPSFIVAKQKNNQNKEAGKTYNGVGKSLLIKIIHFCMGAKKDRYKSFCAELPGWEFSTEFYVQNKKYTAKRSTDNPSRIFLNGEDLAVSKFNEQLGKFLFDIPSNVANLSFRSLFPFFIRPDKNGYVKFNEASVSFNAYQAMLYNAFLLGLDVFLAQKKNELKKEKDRIKNLEKNFNSDTLLRDFFTGNKDVALTIIDIDEKIKKLEDNLKSFKVAGDYHDVQLEADQIENQLFDLNNNIILLQNNVSTIDKSLDIKVSNNKEELEQVYNEASIYFTESLTKTLDDLVCFYEKLMANRKKRLLEQRNKIATEINKKNLEVKKLQDELNKRMKYLGDHQALDVFVAISERSLELKSKRDNLRNYQTLLSEYKEKLREIEKSQIEESERAEKYLREIKTNINELRDYFRGLAKKFYPSSVAGLTIENNDGDNMQRYSIEAKVESDGSDGINNVKIFCYDMTLLFKGQNHSIDFLFHDSRLYDGIDERQKAELFRTIYQEFKNSNKQYIASVNQNQLNEIREYLDPNLYKNVIEDNIILVLTDDDVSGKLLGIQVDIED